METAYLHLVTNHIPIIGVPFALAVLALGLWRKSDDLKAVSFLIFVFLGVATLGVFLLGQGGEDFVEELAGVSHDAIHAHEDMAKVALASTLILGVASLFALIRYKGFAIFKRKGVPVENTPEDKTTSGKGTQFPYWIAIGVLLSALLTSGILGYTGQLGGKIRHPEFHGGAQTSEDEKNNDQDAGEKDENGKGRGRNRGKN